MQFMELYDMGIDCSNSYDTFESLTNLMVENDLDSMETLESYLYMTKNPIDERIINDLDRLGAKLSDLDRALELYCSNSKCDLNSIRYLLSKGIAVNNPTYGRNAIHEYVRSHDIFDPDIIKELIASGCSMDQTAPGGETVLMSACHLPINCGYTPYNPRSNLEQLKVLISLGASPFGEDVLKANFASYLMEDMYLDLPDSFEAIDYFISLGIDFEHKSRSDLKPFPSDLLYNEISLENIRKLRERHIELHGLQRVSALSKAAIEDLSNDDNEQNLQNAHFICSELIDFIENEHHCNVYYGIIALLAYCNLFSEGAPFEKELIDSDFVKSIHNQYKFEFNEIENDIHFANSENMKILKDLFSKD